MSETISLRATRTDQDRIIEIWREASRAGHPFLSEQDLDAQEHLTRREHLPRADIVVAELDGEIVAFIATLGVNIGALFVSPDVQGRGIGRLLIENAQARSTRLKLGVYEANNAARAFYKRLGFIEVDRRERDDEGRPLPMLNFAWDRS